MKMRWKCQEPAYFSIQLVVVAVVITLLAVAVAVDVFIHFIVFGFLVLVRLLLQSGWLAGRMAGWMTGLQVC